jgi:hypothetical protein
MLRSVGRDIPARSATRDAGSLRRIRASRMLLPSSASTRVTAGVDVLVGRGMEIIISTRPTCGKSN